LTEPAPLSTSSAASASVRRENEAKSAKRFVPSKVAFDQTISRTFVSERPIFLASAEGASPVEPIDELEISAWEKCQMVSWRMLSA
jgi:hypothetical protein